MTDLSQYNLIYFRKSDERKFLVKTITKTDYMAIDCVTGEKFRLSQYGLRKDFRPDEGLNRKNKFIRMNPRNEK